MEVSREKALTLLQQYITTQNLLQHCFAVEAIMRHFAQYAQKIAHIDETFDIEYWGLVGLLHDLDWEKYPEEHCDKTAAILKEAGYSDTFIYSIRSHGWTICTHDEPKHFMEKVLFACDELSGLIVATALVRPSKSLSDLTVKSVMKKWKTPTFAAGADRAIIQKGANMLGLELQVLIEECITAMKTVAPTIGLQ